MDMGNEVFSDEDLRQICSHGFTVSEIMRQLNFFSTPPSYLNLLRPCTLRDGIRFIDPKKRRELIDIYDNKRQKYRCVKFVPASGAATRMFRVLLRFRNQGKDIIKELIEERAQSGEKDARELLAFMDGIRRFAFFEDLKAVMSEKDISIESFLDNGNFTEMIRFLLSDDGLSYGDSPKGLIKFHEYVDGSRTPFEEHLVEASSFISGRNGEAHFHFTVSKEHLREFEKLFDKVKSIYEERYQVKFKVGFSIQKDSTDTVAVELDNRPFRQKDSRLLFRPGGHGALLGNLNDIGADVIFIKNIDNVAPDRLKAEICKWKKILGGYLVEIKERIFEYMEVLTSGCTDEAFIDEIKAFVRDELCLRDSGFSENTSIDEDRTNLMERLNRPVRICGMVKNAGEPGGGPFWVKGGNGAVSLQIVETGQVDPHSEDQQAILASSTHFNPVDIACSITDWKGNRFDLKKYVDHEAVLISRKSKDGRELKALEHPGLWNGAMSKWITVFVEVPETTFNPVKTVNDLLRKDHQPE
ncbi:MAG: DUF4301 family protein [Deltaproteobacteria bacterium]|nr:DUF4301 family protein [Deltaproteobacteria bacterium]